MKPTTTRLRLDALGEIMTDPTLVDRHVKGDKLAARALASRVFSLHRSSNLLDVPSYDVVIKIAHVVLDEERDKRREHDGESDVTAALEDALTSVSYATMFRLGCVNDDDPHPYVSVHREYGNPRECRWCVVVVDRERGMPAAYDTAEFFPLDQQDRALDRGYELLATLRTKLAK